MAIRPSIGFLINDVAETCRRMVGDKDGRRREDVFPSQDGVTARKAEELSEGRSTELEGAPTQGKGLFAIDFQGRILPGATPRAKTLLDMEDLSGAGLKTALRMSGEQEFDFHNWLLLGGARHDSLRWEKILKLAPVRELWLRLPGGLRRRLRFDYLRVCDPGGNPKGILVSVVEVA